MPVAPKIALVGMAIEPLIVPFPASEKTSSPASPKSPSWLKSIHIFHFSGYEVPLYPGVKLTFAEVPVIKLSEILVKSL